MDESQIPNYLIHPKLKPGKHYPKELNLLIKFFLYGAKGSPFVPKTGTVRKKVNDEAKVIERTFADLFLKDDLKIKFQSVDRINRKLKFFSPRIQETTDGYKLEITPYITSDAPKRSFGHSVNPGLIGWAWLAKVMDGLDPGLVHQCGYCKKIFFSKQIKKYHNRMRIGEDILDCRRKAFQEKYRKEGRNAKRQKEYRLRKNKKTTLRKAA